MLRSGGANPAGFLDQKPTKKYHSDFIKLLHNNAFKVNDENNLSQESEPKGFNKFKAGADQKERFPNTVGN